MKVFTMISNGEEEDAIFAEVRPHIKRTYNGEREINEAASYGRIQKHLDDYDVVVPNPAKAARYSNKYLGTNYGKNESVKWVFIDGVPDGQEVCNVIAYDKVNQLEKYSIDWYTVVDKWIKQKLKSVYEALDWDLERLTALRAARKLW